MTIKVNEEANRAQSGAWDCGCVPVDKIVCVKHQTAPSHSFVNEARVEELEALDICEFCQVPISAGRHNEPTFNVCGTCYNQTVNSLNAKVSQLEQERDALKRGEFICKKCGLRKDGEYDRDVSF